ncbi:MAG: hypothetical protein ABJB12_16785 [Pseudomonadota bacterium]
MKNIVGLGLILSAALMFAACSSDSDGGTTPTGDAGAGGEFAVIPAAGSGGEAGSTVSAGAGGEGGLLGLGGAPDLGTAGEAAAGTAGAR